VPSPIYRSPVERTPREPHRRVTAPHWWSLLAVSLALLALLIALPGGQSHPLHASADGAHTPSATEQDTPSAGSMTALLGAGAATRGPTPGPTPSKNSTDSDHPARTLPITPPTSASPTVPSATTFLPPPPSSSSPSTTQPMTSGAAQSRASSPTALQGFLQYPEDTSAIYEVPPNPQERTATLDWTVPATLTMTAVCPTGTVDSSGDSPLSLSLPFDAQCEVTITLGSTNTFTPVPYSLTIAP
jgi:hypothetical protein